MFDCVAVRRRVQDVFDIRPLLVNVVAIYFFFLCRGVVCMLANYMKWKIGGTK